MKTEVIEWECEFCKDNCNSELMALNHTKRTGHKLFRLSFFEVSDK